MVDILFILLTLNIVLESLPISSSGHLRLIRYLFPKTPAVDTATEHLMHIPNSVVIVLFLLFHAGNILTISTLFPFLTALCITNLLTGCAYLSMKDLFDRVPLPVGFFLSGIALLSLRFMGNASLTTISVPHAIGIGLAQILSLAPGVSRMALTTVTGIGLGITPLVSFLYSLTCELALIFVAAIVTLRKKNASPYLYFSPSQTSILVMSCLFSLFALELSRVSFEHGYASLLGGYLILLAVSLAALQSIDNKNRYK